MPTFWIGLKKFQLELTMIVSLRKTCAAHVSNKIECKYQKADNRKVIIESPILVAWRYKYLTKTQ